MAAVLEDIDFYMKVPLPDGGFTNGRIDYTHLPAALGIDRLDLSGKRVLDIAANDGFWTFWAEQNGAAELLAIDVDSFEDYDWGWDGPDPALKGTGASNWTEAGAGFRALHALYNSKARRERRTVYALDPATDGQFDLIFNFGLLYHLRHPLLSLDRCRAVCSGAMILETHLVNGFDHLPVSLFYAEDELANVTTNWTGPTEACVVGWLQSAGFPWVFSNRTATHTGYARRIFVACVDEEWANRFHGVEGLDFFGEEYRAGRLRQTRALLSGATRLTVSKALFGGGTQRLMRKIKRFLGRRKLL